MLQNWSDDKESRCMDLLLYESLYYPLDSLNENPHRGNSNLMLDSNTGGIPQSPGQMRTSSVGFLEHAVSEVIAGVREAKQSSLTSALQHQVDAQQAMLDAVVQRLESLDATLAGLQRDSTTAEPAHASPQTPPPLHFGWSPLRRTPQTDATAPRETPPDRAAPASAAVGEIFPPCALATGRVLPRAELLQVVVLRPEFKPDSPSIAVRSRPTTTVPTPSSRTAYPSRL